MVSHLSPHNLLKNYSFSILSWYSYQKLIYHKCEVFCTLNTIPLIYVSNLVLVSHCLDYCGFVISFELEKCVSTNFVLFGDYFNYSGFLAITYEFQV